jgi:hypothetical protein
MNTIIGIDIKNANPCGAELKLCWCPCHKLRIHPYSKKSNILIWKCASCGKRHGRPDEQIIKLIEQFVERFGWTPQPLRLSDDGGIRVPQTATEAPWFVQSHPGYQGRLTANARQRTPLFTSSHYPGN